MSIDNSTSTISLDDCWNRIGVWSPESASCPELKNVTHCRNCEIYSKAGRRVLERDPPEGYRREWTDILASKIGTPGQNLQSVLIFRLGDDWLCINSRLVQEITEVKTIHSMPHYGRGIVKGLVNIRGELRVCVSLGNLLGLEQGEKTAADFGYDVFARMVLIAKDDEQFVFPVTEVFGTHRHEEHELKSVPVTISKAKATYTRNILHWKENHVACLDDELLLYTLKKGMS